MDDVLHALADATRRQILDHLATRDMSAGEIARLFSDISRPAVSQHLTVLREANLVIQRKNGRFVVYSLNPNPLKVFWENWLSKYQTFWGDKLGDLKRVVESADLESDA